MPKPNRLTSREDALNILEQGSYGILSTVSIDGQPYGVPVNYVYLKEENCIFFHCAMIGKKIDNMTANNKVSFTVVLMKRLYKKSIQHIMKVLLPKVPYLLSQMRRRRDKNYFYYVKDFHLIFQIQEKNL